MAKFRSKSIVDAIQYDGSYESGRMVAKTFTDVSVEMWDEPQSHLRLRRMCEGGVVAPGYQPVRIGDWVTRADYGSPLVKVWSPDEFHRRYEDMESSVHAGVTK